MASATKGPDKSARVRRWPRAHLQSRTFGPRSSPVGWERFAKQFLGLMAKDEGLAKRVLELLRRGEKQLALEMSENIGEGRV